MLHTVPPEPRLDPELAPRPQLAIEFARDAGGRTFLARQRSTHPFHLCRALYRPDDPPGQPTLYIQGCSGGLFEGDRWHLDMHVREGASAHVTSAAATLVHRMPGGGSAEQHLHIRLEPGAFFEYFPEPLILFSGSRLRSEAVISLNPGARLIAIDSILPHRLPDDTAPFEWLDSHLRVEDPCGELLARERFRALGPILLGAVPGITGKHACQATVLVLGAGATPLEPLRAVLAAEPLVRAGASLLPEDTGVIARILAPDGATLRAVLLRAWPAARAALGVQPGRPRPR